MNLVILFGPPAVGKMTVGQELVRLTGYKLLHNHMTIDLVAELFAFGTPPFCRLVPAFRRMMVAEAANSRLPGLIITYAWDFDEDEDRAFLDGLRDIVAQQGGETYYAELQTCLEERLRRSGTENRLRHKPTLDAETMRPIYMQLEDRRMDSCGDFPYPERHIRLDNTNLSARDAARRIAEAFGLPMAGKALN
jgi:hypothetical protein